MIDLSKKENQEVSEQEMQEYVDNVYNYTADLMVNKGYSDDAAVRNLVQQGLDEDAANTVVSNLRSQIDEAKDEQANKELLYGFLWAAGGILLTLITGGQYIFWGAVVYGIYKIIMGLYHKM